MYTHNLQRGFSTIELLIAFSVMILSISAVVMVAFGNQSNAIDTELAQRGLYIAQERLEQAAAAMMSGFDVVTSEASPITYNDHYETQLTVTDISECTKRVESNSFWQRDARNLKSSLSMVVGSAEASVALGGNCATTEASGNWDTPQSIGSISPSDFAGQGTDIGLTYIDGKQYALLTTNSSSNSDFYVIDVSDPLNVDSNEDVTSLEAGDAGLNGLSVAKIDDVPYAFVLNNANIEQLRVINLLDPTSPSIVGSATLPNMNHACSPPSSPCLAGQSIFYYDEHVYIGTNYLAFGTPPLQNNELHIYNVSNPSSPVWVNSINVNRDVNSIAVKDHIAYLGTGPGSSAPYSPLNIYDVNPSSSDYLDKVGSFTISVSRKGTSVLTLGNRLYLGLSRTTSGNDLYILDISNAATPIELAKTSLGVNNSNIGALMVNGKFIFAGVEGSNSQNSFQIWDMSDLNSLTRVNVCTSGNPFPQNNTGLRFSDNYIFSSFKSNDPFRIFHDTSAVCAP